MGVYVTHGTDSPFEVRTLDEVFVCFVFPLHVRPNVPLECAMSAAF
jgi:hypothetical protein